MNSAQFSRDSIPHVVFLAIWVVIFSSAFVRTEPAIYDLLTIIVSLISFFFGFVQFNGKFFIPYILLTIFIICNFIPLINMTDEHFSVGFIQTILTIYLISTWLFFSNFLNKYKEKAFFLIMNSYTVSGTISAFLGTAGVLHLIPSASLFVWENTRAVGFFKDPNVFGPFLVPVCVYALYRVIKSDFKAWHWFFALGVCILGVVFSFCRAAWIALIVDFIVFLLLPGSFRLRQKIALIFLIAVVGTLSIIFALQNDQIAHLLADRTGLQKYDTERFATQSSAFEIALSNPIGIGGHQTDFLFGLPPHNLYITTMAEYGWFGFLALIGFMLLSLWNALKGALFDTRSQRPLYGVVVASIVGMMVGVISIDPLHWRHFWLLFALAWMPLTKTSNISSLKSKEKLHLS